MDKLAIRTTMAKQRQVLLPQDVARYSNKIAHKLFTSIEWSGIRSMHIYSSQDRLNEIDTSAICKIISKKFPYVAITKGDSSKHAPIPTTSYDLIVVPLLAFDDQGNRVGFGGGWYDRFLNTQPHALKIGVAYEFQHVPVISVEPYDQSLDMVITEQNTYQFKVAAQ